MESSYKVLNEALRLIRVFHDISQTTLAERLDISKSYLSEIESGKKTPTLELLNKYSDQFGIALSSLMLFSERLESNNFSENTRVYLAKKITKILGWVAEKEECKSDDIKKTA